VEDEESGHGDAEDRLGGPHALGQLVDVLRHGDAMLR
jgi:hypothetical protein